MPYVFAFTDRQRQRRSAPSADARRLAPAAGQPLNTSVRALMEPRFGHDFGQVRVHADLAATEAAESIRAQAYTVGSHITFGAGQYQPHTSAGQRLLAHELAHVVQQQRTRRLDHAAVSVDPDSTHEVDAERAASDVGRGARVNSLHRVTHRAVQR